MHGLSCISCISWYHCHCCCSLAAVGGCLVQNPSQTRLTFVSHSKRPNNVVGTFSIVIMPSAGTHLPPQPKHKDTPASKITRRLTP